LRIGRLWWSESDAFVSLASTRRPREARYIFSSGAHYRNDHTITPCGRFDSRPLRPWLNVAIQRQLLDAVDGRRGAAAADSLCEACVVLFDVDAAAISLIFGGASSGTLGSSGGPARMYDELQFTLGEGPCLDSVTHRNPMLAVDLIEEPRWPAYGAAMLAHNIRAVYAMPIVVAAEFIGALDLFCAQPGQLDGDALAGAIVAAELASITVLDLLDADLHAAASNPDSNAWAELNVLSRVEVSQATGMLMGQLGVEPAEALARLRAHAYAAGRSATDVARDILDRGLKLEAD
jgi:ANTAR domain-containing protein/GAF domain-containing protein